MKEWSIEEIIEENERRKENRKADYDPVRGIGSYGERREYDAEKWDEGKVMLPMDLLDSPEFKKMKSKKDYVKLRCRYDFEYWCKKCVKIKDKTSGTEIPFELNRAQRKMLAVMEEMREHEEPVRVILLKARQWGGSTLVQIYMAWWQTVLYTNCHSLICSHVKDTSATIRGMYSKLLANYPTEYWEEVYTEEVGIQVVKTSSRQENKKEKKEKPKLKNFENSQNIREIAGRKCKITIASIENQEAVRGADYAMAHLSEVAFWRDSARRSPDDFIRAIGGAIHYGDGTLIVMESTANGVGNYFHREWLRSVKGESDKRPVFIPWYDIDIYTMKVKDVETLWSNMDEYELGLWHLGLTLEQINWYHHKRKEYAHHSRMMAEFPTNDMEAFVSSATGVFAREYVDKMREENQEPIATGEIVGLSPTGPDSLKGLRFIPDSTGGLRIWEHPVTGKTESAAQRYIVGVDLGGVSAGADWSVISVMDCGLGKDFKPRIVATWRGHIDHDLLTWKCGAIAKYYCDALLVIESNTLEREHTDGDPSTYILTHLSRYYRQLYFRNDVKGRSRTPGMHINRATKSALITELVAAVRDGSYIERDTLACDELDQYERLPNGAYGARQGCHDDILMTRALILGAMSERRVTPIEKIMRAINR